MLHCCSWLLLAIALARMGRVPSAPLPGTQPLTIEEPLDEVMVAGISRFATAGTCKIRHATRDADWARDYANPEAYSKSVEPNRERLRTIIGAVDHARTADGFEVVAKVGHDGVVARSTSLTVYAVRWPVLPGVTAEGLLLQPRRRAGRARGRTAGRRLDAGNVRWTWSGRKVTTHRPAACSWPQTASKSSCRRSSAGTTHIPAVRWWHTRISRTANSSIGRRLKWAGTSSAMKSKRCRRRSMNSSSSIERENVDLPIGVVGVGEGGLLAFYAAAIDPRIDAAMVSGYFRSAKRSGRSRSTETCGRC